MNALKLTVLLLTVLLLNACSDEDTPSISVPCCATSPFVSTFLYLSFQDALGNDLIKKDWIQLEDGVIRGGLVKSELYTLEYIFPEGVDNPWSTPSNALSVGPPLLSLSDGRVLSIESEANPDCNYLFFLIDCSPDLYDKSSGKIIIRLTCPSLFGDNEAHDIITWWELHPLGGSAICYRVEYGGKEYTEIVYYKLIPYSSIATIILDK